MLSRCWVVTLPFYSETGHLRHRHHSSPEARTSALSWSVTPAHRSRSLEPSDVMPPRTGHSTGGPAGGLRQASGEGVCRERGQPGRPMAHLPPVGDGVSHTPPPARWGGAGRRLHTQQIPPASTPPARRPSCACQSRPRISGNLGRQGPPPPSSHPPPQRRAMKLCSQEQSIQRCPPLPPGQVALRALLSPKHTAKQNVTLKIQA